MDSSGYDKNKYDIRVLYSINGNKIFNINLYTSSVQKMIDGSQNELDSIKNIDMSNVTCLNGYSLENELIKVKEYNISIVINDGITNKFIKKLVDNNYELIM